MSAQKAENMIFARNLKYYISISGKEQKQICKDLRIPESSMSDYVNGKSIPRFKTIERIADYFGAAMSDLMMAEAIDETSARKKMAQKKWQAKFGHVEWSREEIKALIEYAEFLLSKRG